MTTYVGIEVEMGLDDEWHKVGLDEPPENAEVLLAALKTESNDSITQLINDWSLDDFVTVKVEVVHNNNGNVTRTTATWTKP